ncbi:Bacteriophage lambda tail assembly I [Mannheimia sp. USDA-ARS-USMARC-1261]|uniref:tail assembly protein n=1 Tax=Mannheimia sp. USDA-ARS-USMARC-1261 TaxID=1432056 RepID=UPI0003E32254|nr:tail assembly protein [Mannheimia sp. USDA-ARS-USMARC-1261]AHG72944.1 Bacteriophage lambda tail assembly I [Mannheimia sp. USDA-ARS-USMARC-1261]
MSGLLTQIQGLREHLRNGYYKVRIGKNYLNNEQLQTNPMIDLDDNSSIHFTPVIAGAGKAAGIIQAVVGVVLIAVAWWNPLGWSAGAAMMAGAMGASLAMSGAISLLTRTPEMSTGASESEKKQSTSFSNIRNLTPQGRPIPLLYGKMMTSLVLISQGIETFDDVETLNN